MILKIVQISLVLIPLGAQALNLTDLNEKLHQTLYQNYKYSSQCNRMSWPERVLTGPLDRAVDYLAGDPVANPAFPCKTLISNLSRGLKIENQLDILLKKIKATESSSKHCFEPSRQKNIQKIVEQIKAEVSSVHRDAHWSKITDQTKILKHYVNLKRLQLELQTSL